MNVYYNNELIHYGVKGQKWGVRRYQNKDGGLTEAGKKRYSRENKARKIDSKKNAVKNYSKAYDDWTERQDKNDALYNEVASLYKKCGKNKIEQVINIAKNKSPEAQAYSKTFDKWLSTQDALDEQYSELQNLYKKTGKNVVDRIINNIRYG